MDLLLDVNIIVDVCAGREPFASHARQAMGVCRGSGGRQWVYAGAVQTLEYTLMRELARQAASAGETVSNRVCAYRARQLLKTFCAETHWLAALAGEGDVFDAADPEDEQLIRALGRFPDGGIKLLTRDEPLGQRHPQCTIGPEAYLAQSFVQPAVDFVDLKTQQDTLRPAIERNTHRVLHHGKYIMGPEVGELEERLADYVGVSHAIAVASGTDALLIALMALEIGHGDEVITTPFSFIATAEIIALLGAKPVFVDIDPHTYNIDPAQIEDAITNNTRAIMPVSLYGQPADFDAINAIADKHGLPVIEDGAQSFGATYKGKKSGALSTIGCTSFFPSKPLGGYGDSGACFTDDDQLAKRMREIRVHGQDRRYHHPLVGVNGRMDTLQAAILLPKLDLFPEEVALRQQVAQRYTDALADTVTTPYVAPECTSAYAQYTVQVTDREAVQVALKENGVPTAVHYPIGLHNQPAFAGQSQDGNEHFPVADRAAEWVMSLPMHPYLESAEQDHAIRALTHLAATA